MRTRATACMFLQTQTAAAVGRSNCSHGIICKLKPAPTGYTNNRPVSSSAAKTDQHYIVSIKDAQKFVVKSMEAVGTKVTHAEALAEVLVLADQRGHYSHGLNRLG